MARRRAGVIAIESCGLALAGAGVVGKTSQRRPNGGARVAGAPYGLRELGSGLLRTSSSNGIDARRRLLWPPVRCPEPEPVPLSKSDALGARGAIYSPADITTMCTFPA